MSLCRPAKVYGSALKSSVFLPPDRDNKAVPLPLFAFHILWPLWDDLKPENMESSMQRGAVDFCSELLRKIADLTSVEW